MTLACPKRGSNWVPGERKNVKHCGKEEMANKRLLNGLFDEKNKHLKASKKPVVQGGGEGGPRPGGKI